MDCYFHAIFTVLFCCSLSLHTLYFVLIREFSQEVKYNNNNNNNRRQWITQNENPPALNDVLDMFPLLKKLKHVSHY